MATRRPILTKEHFLEGNRQKWCAVFTFIGMFTLGLTAFNELKDPAPFLTFFLSIGVTFILGASASDVMKAWKVESNSTTTVDVSKEEKSETYVSYEYAEIREQEIANLKRVDSKDIDEKAF